MNLERKAYIDHDFGRAGWLTCHPSTWDLPEVPRLLVGLSIGVCVGTVVLVWVIGAFYNIVHAPRDRIRGQTRPTPLIGLAVLVAALAILSRGYWHDLVIGAAWVRIFGLVILVVSTVFTLWARLALGTMWSIGPQVGGDRQLRTRGPYAVTRHPIYTGILGMTLGATLLGGIGQGLPIFPACLIIFEVKIRMEEHLMVEIFPDRYPRYRCEVPQLVPGLFLLRRHRPAGPT